MLSDLEELDYLICTSNTLTISDIVSVILLHASVPATRTYIVRGGDRKFRPEELSRNTYS